MAVGSTWPKRNSASSASNASTAEFLTSPHSPPKWPPGNPHATPPAAESTGNSPPTTHAPNSNASTRQFSPVEALGAFSPCRHWHRGHGVAIIQPHARRVRTFPESRGDPALFIQRSAAGRALLDLAGGVELELRRLRGVSFDARLVDDHQLATLLAI